MRSGGNHRGRRRSGRSAPSRRATSRRWRRRSHHRHGLTAHQKYGSRGGAGALSSTRTAPSGTRLVAVEDLQAGLDLAVEARGDPEAHPPSPSSVEPVRTAGPSRSSAPRGRVHWRRGTAGW